MREDEAKQKWCPFVRVIIGPDNATWQGQMLTNRGDIPADNTHTACLGSACMAWRQEGESALKPTRVHPNVLENHWKGWTVTDDTPDYRGYVEISPPATEPTGYCGLSEPK